MPSLSQLARTLRALSLLNLTAAATFVNARFTIQRPIYAIAHMVLRPEAVTAALSHGANAIEVDLIAWKEWWADHDGGDDSAGSTARELFIFIAEQRKSGKDITYMAGYQEPRRVSEGESVLHPGFTGLSECNEAICLSGPGDKVVKLYDSTAPSLLVKQRVMDHGDVDETVFWRLSRAKWEDLLGPASGTRGQE